MFPEIIKIGGNLKDGLISIQRRGDLLLVVSWPSGVPGVNESIILQEPYTEKAKYQLVNKWNEFKMMRTRLSHTLEDAIVLEENDF